MQSSSHRDFYRGGGGPETIAAPLITQTNNINGITSQVFFFQLMNHEHIEHIGSKLESILL